MDILHCTTYIDRKMEPGKNYIIEHTSMKKLVSSYLCEGAESSCVLFGKCECLDHCRFGQLYLEKAGETNENRN